MIQSSIHMKITCLFGAALLLLAAGCAHSVKSPVTPNLSTPPTTSNSSSESDTRGETVMVTYHVQSDQINAFRQLIASAWKTYRDAGMVYSSPHVIVQGREDGGKPYVVEIFTWKKAPDHPSPRVLEAWRMEQSMCEPRFNRPGLDGGVMTLLSGK
jgi:hypothetical protein